MRYLTYASMIFMGGIGFFYLYSHASCRQADLIIFSYNRPLQLYALLESVQTHMSGLDQVAVICRVDDEACKSGYEIVRKNFPFVVFHYQETPATSDFKPLTMHVFKSTPSDYVLFAVDDIVVKQKVNMSECIEYLERYNAYGFYLRLGTHLSACYSLNIKQPLPPLHHEIDNVYSWYFYQGKGDWAYPCSLDMTLFRKKDIEVQIEKLPYNSPNQLEGRWSMCIASLMKHKGLCFHDTVIVNLPLNRVQNEYLNRVQNEYTHKELAALFMKGKKMDIIPLFAVKNKAAHMEYSPSFIDRT